MSKGKAERKQWERRLDHPFVSWLEKAREKDGSRRFEFEERWYTQGERDFPILCLATYRRIQPYVLPHFSPGVWIWVGMKSSKDDDWTEGPMVAAIPVELVPEAIDMLRRAAALEDA